jgi:hypothetical protein
LEQPDITAPAFFNAGKNAGFGRIKKNCHSVSRSIVNCVFSSG